MRIYITLLFSLIGFGFLNAQTIKVAILDFENTSGKTEYDALGKAISSMLITDLANNIHPKKVEFFERSQLNKLLDEQKLQKSKDFDAKTAVDFGKLSGVNYVFVGSVFVLDGTCNFSSKLVDVQTSKILFAKEVSGKIEAWLQLKSQLAEAIASQLNNPITLDPAYKDQSTTLATLNQYGKILSTMDGGDVEKAEQMRSLFEETNPDFKYYSEIKEDIEELKKQVEKNTEDIEVLKNSGDLVINAVSIEQYTNNLNSQLLTFNERFDVFQEMAYKFTDSLNEAIEGKENQYNFLNYFTISDLKFALNPESDVYLNGMKYQMSFLDTIKSIDQKKIILQLIREELNWILNNYSLKISLNKEKQIDEIKLISILNLYKSALNQFKNIYLPDFSIEELVFLELFIGSDFVRQGYRINLVAKNDTLPFKTAEFETYRLSIISDFLSRLEKDYGVEARIVKLLREISVTSINKTENFQIAMAYIYKKELEKKNALKDINNKLFCYQLESITWDKYKRISQSQLWKIPPNLIIDETGISYYEK
jgi:TolB-like protein